MYIINSISYTVARDKEIERERERESEREDIININPFTGKIRWRRDISKLRMPKKYIISSQ